MINCADGPGYGIVGNELKSRLAALRSRFAGSERVLRLRAAAAARFAFTPVLKALRASAGAALKEPA
jgi:hypothetical protein